MIRRVGISVINADERSFINEQKWRLEIVMGGGGGGG